MRVLGWPVPASVAALTSTVYGTKGAIKKEKRD